MQESADLVRDLAGAHPYLLANLTGLPLLVVVIILSRSIPSVVVAGLVLAPFAPLAMLHEAHYWSPHRLGGLAWGIEDALYLFISGAFSYGVAHFFKTMPRVEAASIRTAFQRVLTLSLFGAGGWLALSNLGLGSFEANCLIAGAAVIAGTAMRWRRAVPALCAGVACTLFHLFNVSIVMSIVPAFSENFATGAIHSILQREALFQFLFTTAHVLFFSWVIEPRDRIQAGGS